jgi:ABC-type transport system involved in multi-copper enzyme maturation permease subunit
LIESVEGQPAEELKTSQEKPARESRRRSDPSFVREITLQEDLIDELNGIIANRDLYKEEAWSRRSLGSTAEAKEYLDRPLDELGEIQLKRFNRLLVANALAPSIDAGNPTALEIHYAIWTLPFPLPLTQQQFAQSLVTNLPYYFDKFVLSIGLLIAIIITANMVPDTFEPGSLNLLLSKPISRWGLFTAKFFGGCVFIALCASYLFVGVWLWLGLGMGVWDRAILLSIPLYVIVFAIYFAVSAVVGLLFRSPIVSVILTLLFWVACFTVGMLYGVFHNKISNDERIALVPMAGKLLSLDVFQRVLVWNEKNNQWDIRQDVEMNREEQIGMSVAAYIGPLRDDPGFSRFSGPIKPVFDRQNNRVLVSRMSLNSLGGFGKPLYVGTYDELDFKQIGKYPDGTLEMFETPQGLAVITASGAFYRLETEVYDAAVAKAGVGVNAENQAPTGTTEKSVQSVAELFTAIGPEDNQMIEAASLVDFSYPRNEFAAYEAGKVRVYHAASQRYELRKEAELTFDFRKNMSAMLAFGDRHILLAFGNGKVFVLNADSLELEKEFQLESRSGVRAVASSPNGRYFGVLYRNGNLWLADSQREINFSQGSVGNQGMIGSFAFEEKDRCWINFDGDRIAQYDLITRSRIARHTPQGSFVSNAYRYLVRPLYRIFPKPGEFYKVVSHLATSGDTANNQDIDLIQTPSRESSDPWAPLRSGLIFMFGMLFLGCLYFQFKDY